MKLFRFSFMLGLSAATAILVFTASSVVSASPVLEEEIEALIQKDWDAISSAEQRAVSGRILTRAASDSGIYPNTETPMVTEDERKLIADRVPQECAAHFLGEAEKLKNGKYSRNGWLTHISKCKMCCRPYMTGIITKHVTKIANGPHSVVLFDFNRSEIREPYKQKLRLLLNRHFADGEDRKVLLIGRASNVGGREMNMELSKRRTLAVRDFLMSEGHIAEGQSTYMLFGSQPPRLTGELARVYSVGSSEIENTSFTGADPDGSFRVNQSVVVAIYR